MKKTEYFLSGLHEFTGVPQALTKCIEKRDAFMETNEIEEVENENVEIFTVASGSNVYVLLTLTYYSRK